jgi:predicted O-methyltransferase YrrM
MPEAKPECVPEITIEDIVDTRQPLFLLSPEKPEGDGSISTFELVCLCAIVRERAPRRAFEIGTFRGRACLNIAANSAECEVWTLDLPPEDAERTRLAIENLDKQYIAKPLSGECFRDAPEAARIAQLYGDSAVFDFSPYVGAMDLVFVDGSHSEAYVRNDAERARHMLAPGGIILFHDYGAG